MTPAECAWFVRLTRLGASSRYRSVPLSIQVPHQLAAWPGPGCWCAVIHGSVGAGKTWLATRIFGSRFDPYKYDSENKPRWIDAMDALEQVRAEFGGDGDGKTFRRLRDAAGLLIDDLSAGRLTDWTRDRWTTLIRHRHAARLPTLITTNAAGVLGLAVSHENPYGFDGATISRLCEESVEYALTGADRRMIA